MDLTDGEVNLLDNGHLSARFTFHKKVCFVWDNFKQIIFLVKILRLTTWFEEWPSLSW